MGATLNKFEVWEMQCCRRQGAVDGPILVAYRGCASPKEGVFRDRWHLGFRGFMNWCGCNFIGGDTQHKKKDQGIM